MQSSLDYASKVVAGTWCTARVATFALLALVATGCHHKHAGGGDMSGVDGDMSAIADMFGDGGGDDGGTGGDGGSSCLAGGVTCAVNSDCCSAVCDPTTHVCGASLCKPSGQTCTTAGDCCNLNCVGNVCSAQACASDGQACSASGAACCSGPNACQNGTCAQLGIGCHTSGNACAANIDCCSGSCDSTSGRCAAPSTISYCSQVNDICYKDADCCTGVCQVGSTGAGTCQAIPGSSCDVDGTVCTACSATNTTTVAKCCSTYCGEFGATSSTICQPAGGCRIQGDLCTKDVDCCGGSSATMCVLPGDGEVKCNIFDATRGLGTCGAPSVSTCTSGTCIPEGDVCHCQLVDSKGICWDSCPAGETCKPLPSGCSVSGVNSNCCGKPGANKMTCRIDSVGVPRCYTLNACMTAGSSCATSADCCNGNVCLPGSTGKYVCGTTACVSEGAACTATSDCCGGTGDVCFIAPGHTTGICENPNPPPDAGVSTDGGTPTTDGGMATPTDMALCSYAGQQCSVTQGCCSGAACLTNNAGTACTSATGCTCNIIIL